MISKISPHMRSKILLIYIFMLPALLLNSVAVVILQLVNSGAATMATASYLEAFKDLSIVVASFAFASFIPKLGYKPSLITGVLFSLAGCLLMSISTGIIADRIFFVLAGVGFALIKVSAYSYVGSLINDEKEHASFLSILEGFFMIGMLAGFWLFGFFTRHYNWVDTYWLLALMCALGIIASLMLNKETTKKDTPKVTAKTYNPMDILSLLTSAMVWSFAAMIFCYVFIEQGLTTWLPTFENHILYISDSISVEITSILAGSIAIGRLVSGVVMRYIHWRKVLITNILIALTLLFFTNYLSSEYHHAHDGITIATLWQDVPWIAYLIPAVGFFIAPIYPTLCSSILTSQSKERQSSVAAVIIVFSALGGTLGSRIVGHCFFIFGGLSAIKVPIVPLIILLVAIIPYYYFFKKNKQRLTTSKQSN